MSLKRNQPARPTPLKRLSKPDVDSSVESSSPPPVSEPSPDNSLALDEGLLAVLKHLKSDPEVAYVLASVRKGIANAGTLSPEEKARILADVQQALEQSPSVLRALREYRG